MVTRRIVFFPRAEKVFDEKFYISNGLGVPLLQEYEWLAIHSRFLGHNHKII